MKTKETVAEWMAVDARETLEPTAPEDEKEEHGAAAAITADLEPVRETEVAVTEDAAPEDTIEANTD